MNTIDIGFVEKCKSWSLESRFFPSKVGGKPAWLNLKNLPKSVDVQCEICKTPCIFLCQIYAPYEDDPRAFHRTLYVFVCKNEACYKPNNNENLKVFRSQLPRENPFYPFEPPKTQESWRSDIQAEKWTKTCVVCGIFAPYCCSKCKSLYYCCRTHQVFHWKAGHKLQCSKELPEQENTSATLKDIGDILFPEYEIVMNTEVKNEQQREENDLAMEIKEIERFESLVKSGKAGTLQAEKDVDADLQNLCKAENDETFAHFIEEVKDYPDQVLRYDRGGTPLHISLSSRLLNIPKCGGCNSDRQFEFQIMPQLLNYLGFQNVLQSFDWGTLLIFTCPNSCEPKSGYAAEYIWKEDIVEVVSKTISGNK